MTDKEILQIYRQGFIDELYNIKNPPKEFTPKRAYELGQTHAELGDETKSFDRLTDEQILMIIKVLR